MGASWGETKKKHKAFNLVLFLQWYAIKPATPLTKMYFVLQRSNFNDTGGDDQTRTDYLYVANVSLYRVSYIPAFQSALIVYSKIKKISNVLGHKNEKNLFFFIVDPE